jgi:hypothetical protein
LGWDIETVSLAGQQTVVAGYDGELMGGMVLSFLTFGERGSVVAVMSNTAYADTASLALRIADGFAVAKSGPARK